MRLSLTFLSLSLLTILVGSSHADLLPADTPIPQVIDHYINTPLQEQGIAPAPLLDDRGFLRRVSLDLVGRIPTLAETQAFVSSSDPAKKVQLVDALMASGGYLRHQVTEFDTMLAPENAGRRNGNLRGYLTAAFKENRSWERIFRDLIVADEKEPVQKGASQFLKSRVKDLDRLTTEVSVLFFGVNISCAQCHDHPLVHDWKQDHYYGMKSFFARTYEVGQFLGERDQGSVQFKTTKNVTKSARMMFLTGKVVDAPGMDAPADGKPNKANKKNKDNPASPPPPPKFSARAALAELALQPGQNDFFARSIVNRIWHRLFGLGLVTPIDQMHSENAPSHPELLQWLARDLVAHGYDLRRLIRGIVLSDAYARSSRFEGEKTPPVRSFGVARLRALTPMQLATSLRIASSDPEQFPANLKAEELDRKIEAVENSARGFASLLEQPRDDFQISVSEALLFSNSDRVHKEFLSDGSDRLLGRLKKIANPEQAVELAVQTVLNRPASAEEKKAMVDYLAARSDRLTEGYRQMVWALLSSAEFRFNH